MERKIQKIKEVPYEYHLTIDSTKKRVKIVKKMENIVRQSMEQKDLMAYLREYLDFKACAIYQHISKENNPKIRVEIHHGPFTLYDICDVVLQKWIDSGMPLNLLYMASEVVELHYKNMVGLVPLSKSVHESVTNHSDKIIIPLYMFHGDYKKFIKDYADYISDDLIDKYERAIEDTKKVTKETFDAWNSDFTYLEYGQKIPEHIEIEVTEDGKDITKEVTDDEDMHNKIKSMFIA